MSLLRCPPWDCCWPAALGRGGPPQAACRAAGSGHRLALWVACTGALHLDGLADTADAWVGGRGDRERTLADHEGSVFARSPWPQSCVCCCVKFGHFRRCAMRWVLRLERPALRLRWCVCHRCWRAPLPWSLFAHTPYVRAQGIGADLRSISHGQERAGYVPLTALAVIAACGRHGLLAIAGAADGLTHHAAGVCSTSGRHDGDCTGALIEVTETLDVEIRCQLNAAMIRCSSPRSPPSSFSWRYPAGDRDPRIGCRSDARPWSCRGSRM